MNGLFDNAMPNMMGVADMGGAGVSQFQPIVDDADFMQRMARGDFADWDNLGPDAQAGVMQYLNTPESALTGQQIAQGGAGEAGQLGMSAAKDMSQFAQAAPMEGLMGMATKQQQPQKAPFQMQQGLMTPWG